MGDLRLPTSDLRLPISDLRLPTSDLRPYQGMRQVMEGGLRVGSL